MNKKDFENFFQDNEKSEHNNDIFQLNNRPNKQNEEESLKDHALSYKLTLRKQKIQKTLYLKRNIEFKKLKNNYYEELEKIEYTQDDFFNEKIYNDLKDSYLKKDEKKIRNIIYSMTLLLNDIKLDIIFFNKMFLKDNSSINKEGDSINKENLLFLILEIGFNTQEKAIFNFCCNLILNFSYISDDFCKQIITEKNIEEIFNKLIYFYPLFAESKKINNHCDILEEQTKKNESYYFGNQILKILGNLFISSKTFEAFEANNYYNKIFFLLSTFDLDYENKENISFRYEYLDTLIWLVDMILILVDNIYIYYSNNINNIIPNLLDIIRAFYYTEETEILNRIIYLIEYLSYINDELIIKIVESKGINNLINLFGYLFVSDKNSGEIILTAEIIFKIINIFSNIFTLDSKYLKNFDYSQFALVLERLISLYKMHHINHFDIQSGLLGLLSNLACFNDIDEIVYRILMNNNIIKYLFNYYNKYHLSDILLFIENITIKQLKRIRDNILNMGGFEIIKNNICNYNEDNKDILEKCIKILYKIIEGEKAFNIRLLFEKLYNTPIPDKIKDIASNVDLSIESENIIKSIVKDFEIYEKSLDLYD